MARRRARRTIDLDTLLQAAPILRAQHAVWTSGGAIGLSAECTARGLVL